MTLTNNVVIEASSLLETVVRSRPFRNVEAVMRHVDLRLPQTTNAEGTTLHLFQTGEDHRVCAVVSS